jgi:capsid protein
MAARMTELDYALIFHANPGEEVKGIERNIPGRNFSESLLMFLRLLGLPLGLPLEIILLDWTKSNYSQSRAVLEQAFQTFLRWQMKLDQFVLTPLVAWKKRLWEQSGLLAERRDFAFEWIKPTFPWLDQLKESQAYGEKLDRGMVTHSRVCKSLNTEREDVIDGREAEVRDAIDRAKKIKADTGVEVPWQIFAGLKAPTGAAENAAAGKAQDKSEEKSDADTADDDTE